MVLICVLNISFGDYDDDVAVVVVGIQTYVHALMAILSTGLSYVSARNIRVRMGFL